MLVFKLQLFSVNSGLVLQSPTAGLQGHTYHHSIWVQIFLIPNLIIVLLWKLPLHFLEQLPYPSALNTIPVPTSLTSAFSPHWAFSIQLPLLIPGLCSLALLSVFKLCLFIWLFHQHWRLHIWTTNSPPDLVLFPFTATLKSLPSLGLAMLLPIIAQLCVTWLLLRPITGSVLSKELVPIWDEHFNPFSFFSFNNIQHV